MSVITEKRRELRAQARERQKSTVPELRALVRQQRKAKKKRVATCKREMKRRAAAVQTDAKKARELLRLGIQRAKQKAREAGRLCKVTATEQELVKLDRALGAVQTEREAIADLRARAGRLKDPRGIAGGRRRAEQRAESDDQVGRNVADDPDLAALWAGLDKRQFKETDRRTRTEAFLEWVHDHPEALAELRHKQQEAYDREAAELFATLQPPDPPIGKMTDDELAGLARDHERAGEFIAAGDVPF